jgi:N-acetylglucosamine malate deacetylase 1
MALPRAVTRLIARGKPFVPERAWPLLLTLRSARGQRPLVAEPTLRNAVVLAAHPDDEAMGCAGTIALLRRAGARVTVAFVTDGELTRGADLPVAEVAQRRRSEAEAACRSLGVDDVRSWGLPDGSLTDRVDDVAAHVGRLLAEVAPDGVLLPWFLDDHPDHAALAAALDRCPPPLAVELWGYEVWTPLAANRIVDISAVVALKEGALAIHRTARQAFDISAALGLNRWRSVQGLLGRGYAEAFVVGPAPDWLALRRKLIYG